MKRDVPREFLRTLGAVPLCLVLTSTVACRDSSDGWTPPSPVPFPAPQPTPPLQPEPESCQEPRCVLSGSSAARSVSAGHRIELVAGTFLNLRLRASNPSVRLGMWLGLCREVGSCWTSYEEFGRTHTLDLAANGLNVGDSVVVQVLNDTDTATAYTLTTELDNDTFPNPADPTLCVPSLISPSKDAALDNGRSDGADPVVWEFDWSDCPGATAYDLFVIGPSAAIPLIDDTVTESSYRHLSCGYVLVRQRWRWRVRAETNGEWGSWSAERTFNVEALDTDRSSECFDETQ